MQSREFVIGNVENVKKLVELTRNYAEEIDVVKGRYVIDAKSVLGVLSLDISQPVTITIHTDDLNVGDKLFVALTELLGK